MTTEEIAIAYDRLAQARHTLFEAAYDEAELKFKVEKAETEALAAGKIVGKNPEERKAHAALLFAEECAALLAAEQNRRGAQMEFDIADAKVDCLKLQMRLMEWTH